MPIFIDCAVGGGIDTSDATAVPDDVFNGKIFYNSNGKQTGSMVKTIEILPVNNVDEERYLSVPISYFDVYFNDGKAYPSSQYHNSGSFFAYNRIVSVPNVRKFLAITIDNATWEIPKEFWSSNNGESKLIYPNIRIYKYLYGDYEILSQLCFKDNTIYIYQVSNSGIMNITYV